jgi:hypothetical protein
LVHEKLPTEDPANLSPAKLLEFTLVVQKQKKEVRQKVQVVILPKESTNEIIFPTYLRGDTLIASGDKNQERWGDKFSILTVNSGSGRQLVVKHANKIANLDKNGSPSNDLKGTPIAGVWEIRSMLTEADKKDMSSAPATLRIIATIQYTGR